MSDYMASICDVGRLTAEAAAAPEQLASRPACDWPGKCKHQHQRPSPAAAPARAAPTDGCGACGDACRSRGSCRPDKNRRKK